MRVVVAHGRAGERRRFRRVLAEAGHEVAECDCVDAALTRCLEWQPDVAVVDEAAGDRLVERIKGHPEAFHTAVLLVETTGPPVERAAEALQRGVQDILVTRSPASRRAASSSRSSRAWSAAPAATSGR